MKYFYYKVFRIATPTPGIARLVNRIWVLDRAKQVANCYSTQAAFVWGLSCFFTLVYRSHCSWLVSTNVSVDMSFTAESLASVSWSKFSSQAFNSVSSAVEIASSEYWQFLSDSFFFCQRFSFPVEDFLFFNKNSLIYFVSITKSFHSNFRKAFFDVIFIHSQSMSRSIPYL